MRIVDTHQHLWDLRRFTLPWTKGAGEPLEKDHLPADYDAAIVGTGVERAVYMEVDVAPQQRRDEAAWACARGPAVVGGNPADPGFAAYLDAIAHPNLKGVRQVLHGGLPAGACRTPDFIRGARELGKRRLRFDLCLRPLELADGARLAKECPETRFILDHCGNGDVKATPADRDKWKRGVEAVAKQPNTICKISGIIVSAKGTAWSAQDLAPLVDHCLDTFGFDRVVFGSDWPVCTLTAPLAEWVRALEQITARRTESERARLFHGNAIRHYELGA